MASTNRFFDQTGLSVVDGAVAKASQLNSLTGETNKAFDLIESEINSINVGYLLSFQWANNEPGDEIDPINYPGRYSSYANALEAQGWTVGPAGTALEADGVTVIQHSAKEEADKANASAIQAASSESICTDAENMAQEWAENPEDTPITGASGSFSSLHWSTKAKHSEDNAQSSEDQAKLSETNAAASETAAYNWAEWDPIGGSPVPEGDGSERSAHYWANQALGALSGVADIIVTDPVTIDKTDPQIPIIGLRPLTSADVGLDQVDNTSDLNKPISTATQAALDTLTTGKVSSVTSQEPIVMLGSAQNPIVTWTGDQTDVGLDQVDNTSDANKPVSDDTQAALDLKEDDLGLPAADGQYLASDQAGVRSWETVTAPNGLPVGGTTDQMLVKQSNADYDTWWQDQPDPGEGGGGAGGLEWVEPDDGDLVVNGTFSTDTTGWIEANAPVVTVANGEVNIEAAGNTNPYIYQRPSTEVGETYIASFEVISGEPARIRAGTTNGGAEYEEITSAGVGIHTIQFVATAPTVSLRFGPQGVASGLSTTFDNIQLHEVGAGVPDITAEPGKGYPLYSAQTLVLPATPAQNDQVGFKDYENNFGLSEAFIDPNGNPIEDDGTGIMTLAITGQAGQFTWIEDRWSITNATDQSGVVLNKPLFHVREEYPQGTDPVDLGDSVVETVTLNTTVTNEISGAALASDLVTLPAGEYWVEADTGVSGGGRGARIALRNNATNANLLLSNNFGSNDNNTVSFGNISQRLVLTEATVLKVVINTALSGGIRGLKSPGEIGGPEIYSNLRIWQLDTDIKSITVQDPEMYLKKPLLQVQHIEASGTGGGTAAIGWQQRYLNTVKTNEIPGASLSGNDVILPAGEYFLDGLAFVGTDSGNGFAKTVLTDNANVLVVNGIGGSSRESYQSVFGGRFTLTQETTLKVRSYFSANRDLGLGTPISSGEPEVYVDLRIYQEDAVVQAPKVYNQPIQAIPGAYVTGNVYGGELSYVDGTTFNVASVSCMSDDLTLPLALVGPTLVDLGSPQINTVYNVFLVRTTSAAYEIQVDTDVDGLNLTDITHKRWLGFVRANASGAICNFIQSGDQMSFVKSSDNRLPTVTPNSIGTSVTVDHSGMLPVPRIATIWYGAYGTNSSNGVLYSTIDGVSNEMYVGRNTNSEGDANANAWGNPQYTPPISVTFSTARRFYRDSYSMIPLIRGVTLKR